MSGTWLSTNGYVMENMQISSVGISFLEVYIQVLETFLMVPAASAGIVPLTCLKVRGWHSDLEITSMQMKKYVCI